jgi:phosphopantetheine--protein transferase-like protein
MGMIGIDLLFIPEFEMQYEINKTAFINKAFNLSEIKRLDINHLAGLYAAKEAIYKAAEKPPKKLTDILISYNTSGKPEANIGKQKFSISISNHGDYVVAVALRLD